MKRNLSLPVFLVCFWTLQCGFSSALAQVTPDGTTSTTVNADGNNFTIEEGDRAGNNLFHSFKDFSVPNGGSAFFNNNPDIANIFSRVTGGNISNIDGLLKANGSANLFLINPAGIIFGKGAALSIGGSFYGSTADSLLFPNGVEFSATDTEKPILTINAPIGLGFRDNPQPITNQSVANGVGLQVNAGKNITLVGGNLNFDAGKLTARGGRIELGGLSVAGEVGITDNGSLTFPDGVTKSDVSLDNGATVNVTNITGNSGGFLAVNARNLQLLNGSILLAGIFEDVGKQGGEIDITAENLSLINGPYIITSASGTNVKPGDIKIKVSGATILEGFPVASNNQQQKPSLATITSLLNPNSTGTSGNIFLETGSLTLKNGGLISSGNLGLGNTGDIKIKAENAIRLDGVEDTNLNDRINDFIINDNVNLTNISSVTTGEVNSGNIQISAGSLEILDGASIFSATLRNGNAGNIDLDVRGAITLAGNPPILLENTIINSSSSIYSVTGTSTLTGLGQAIGSSGNINLKANSLSLSESGIYTFTSARGNAGDINLKTNNFISLQNNSLISSAIQFGGNGKGGDLNIQTATLNLTGGSRISAVLSGTAIGLLPAQGEAGNINITATDSVNISGFNPTVSTVVNPYNPATNAKEGLESSGIFVSSDKGTIGNPGAITIATGALRLAEGGLIVASTQNQSNAGNITINANSLEAINGGQILATTKSGGNAGNINLNIAKDISIAGSDSTYANRIAQRPNRVNNQGAESAILAVTTAESTGNGGNISINSTGLTIAEKGRVSVDSKGEGNGGIVSIKADDLTLNNEASISASTTAGEGGEIFLTIDDNLIFKNNSNITARAFGTANGGNIDLDADFIITFPNQNNDIIASAEQGSGGNIKINAQSVFGLQQRPLNPITNDINASSELGLNGKIDINTPDVDPFQETAESPKNVVEQDEVVAGVCDANQTARDIMDGTTNSFVVNGKGGVPPEPTKPFAAENLIINGQSVEPNVAVENRALQEQYPPIMTDYGAIYPARGIVKKPDGSIYLTAYPTDNTQRVPNGSANCLERAMSR